MPYSRRLMTLHLHALHIDKWDWAGDNPGKIRQDLLAKNPKLAAPRDPEEALLEEITEYCWRAYQKAQMSAGHLVIGRTRGKGRTGLEDADLYDKVADIGAGATILDPSTSGNLLKVDKWAVAVNDAWILGGVHRHGTFRLASRRRSENLWDPKERRLVVTARELLGLLHFGYELEQVGPWQVMTCRNTVAADGADLVKYARYIETECTVRAATKVLEQAEDVDGVRAPEKVAIKPWTPSTGIGPGPR